MRSLTEMWSKFSSSADALACGVSGVSWWPRIAGQLVVTPATRFEDRARAKFIRSMRAAVLFQASDFME